LVEQFCFKLRKLTRETARTIATWQYEPPYDVYSFNPDQVEETVKWILIPRYHYYSVWDEGNELVGFRCFGEDARVPGGDYSADALDMGGGLRPDLTGKGLGTPFMKAAFGFASEIFKPKAFRATVMAFNQRALRVCARVGYRQVQEFTSPHSGRLFIIMMREVIE